MAKGDRAILLSSGFTITNDTKDTAPAVEKIKNFAVTYGTDKGEVILSMDAVLRPKGFGGYYALSPVQNDAWMHAPGGGRIISVTNLQPGKEYDFQMYFVNYKGKTIYSDIITKIVV